MKKNLQIKKFIDKKICGLGEKFPEKSLSFQVNIPEDLEYELEEQTFSILLDNLLSNAIKFSPEKVKIKIYADEKSFSVSDNGSGISDEEQEKIWEKFYRKDTKKE